MATKNATIAATSVAEKKTADVAVMDFAADAGLGLEGADKASFAIPFLIVLQSNSPQLETMKDAKAGMFLNSVTEELFTAVSVVPVAFQRRYLAWAPRSSGGGFKGEFTVAQVEGHENELKWVKAPDHNGTMQMTMPDGSILKDTRHHFIMVLSDNGAPMQAIFSFASTQIKKSKKWMSRIQSIQMKGPDGKGFNPPSFSQVYSCTTVNEENDRGKWKGIVIELIGPVKDPALYNAAKAFHNLIVAGKVETAPPVAADDEGKGDEKF